MKQTLKHSVRSDNVAKITSAIELIDAARRLATSDGDPKRRLGGVARLREVTLLEATRLLRSARKTA